MLKVSESAELGSGADEVWALVGDFAGVLVALGVPVVADGNEVGAVRRISGPGGEMVERLEALDHVARLLTYRMLEAGALPVANYVSSMHVSEAGDGRCRLTWEATFDAAGVDDEQAVNTIFETYRGGLAGLQKRFGS